MRLFWKKKEKKEKSGNFKEFLAKLSKGLMLPIAMLPIAGIFVGIGTAITSTAPSADSLQMLIGNIISKPGSVIFDNLPVLFCIAVAIAFTGDAGVAGLSAFVGWIVFCALQNALIISHKDDVSEAIAYNFLFYKFSSDQFNSIFATNLGIQSLSTGVFGGIIVGFVISILYNRYKNIQLPTVIGFFSGVRFIPIITFLSTLILGLLFALIWPIIGMGFFYMGQGLSSAPAGLNSLVWGFFNRALVPFGLHHVINTAVWFSSIGGTFDLTKEAVIKVDGFYYTVGQAGWTWNQVLTSIGQEAGTQVYGDINIYTFLEKLTGRNFSLIALDGGTLTNYTLNIDSIFSGTAYTNDNLVTCNPGQYTSGAFIFMMLALPAAALAMLMAAPKGENRKIASSIVISAGLVSMLTGVTEPIEFTFLFLAPWLYWGFHSIMGAIAFMIPTALSIYMPTGWGCHVSFTFSGGLIDFIIYGVLQDVKGAGSNCWYLAAIGGAYAIIYYFVFYWTIKKFNLATPGRAPGAKLFTKKDYLAKKEKAKSNGGISDLANEVIKAYGGKANIKNVDACITKLRIQVADPKKVSKARLMELGAKGVMYPSKQSVYAVFGTDADRIKNEIKTIL